MQIWENRGVWGYWLVLPFGHTPCLISAICPVFMLNSLLTFCCVRDYPSVCMCVCVSKGKPVGRADSQRDQGSPGQLLERLWGLGLFKDEPCLCVCVCMYFCKGEATEGVGQRRDHGSRPTTSGAVHLSGVRVCGLGSRGS